MKRVNMFLLISFVLMYVTQFGVLALLRLNDFPAVHPVVQALYILGGASPTLAALYVVFKLYGKEEKDTYFANLFRFKVPVVWWCYALFIPFLLLLFVNLLHYRSLAHLSLETGQIQKWQTAFFHVNLSCRSKGRKYAGVNFGHHCLPRATPG